MLCWDKTPDITSLATKATLNAKINEGKGEIPYLLLLFLKPSWQNFMRPIFRLSCFDQIM